MSGQLLENQKSETRADRPRMVRSDRPRCDRGESGNEASILAIYPACPATVLSMTALKQLAFSLAFAITAVAAAQYIMWILNGQP